MPEDSVHFYSEALLFWLERRDEWDRRYRRSKDAQEGNECRVNASGCNRWAANASARLNEELDRKLNSP